MVGFGRKASWKFCGTLLKILHRAQQKVGCKCRTGCHTRRCSCRKHVVLVADALAVIMYHPLVRIEGVILMMVAMVRYKSGRYSLPRSVKF